MQGLKANSLFKNNILLFAFLIFINLIKGVYVFNTKISLIVNNDIKNKIKKNKTDSQKKYLY